MSKTPVRKSASRFYRSLLTTAGIALAGLLPCGCGFTLEDGYKPRALDASPDTRKSYYASPFTDQADPAGKEGGGGGGGMHAGGR